MTRLPQSKTNSRLASGPPAAKIAFSNRMELALESIGLIAGSRSLPLDLPGWPAPPPPFGEYLPRRKQRRSPCTTTLSRFWDPRSCETATTKQESRAISWAIVSLVSNFSFHSNADSLSHHVRRVRRGDRRTRHDQWESGQSRGFAFVTMGTAQEAAKAISEMNGATLDGRALRVNEAEERRQSRGGGGGGGGGGKRERW